MLPCQTRVLSINLMTHSTVTASLTPPPLPHSLAHEVLQDAGLAGGLAAHHGDLRQVDGVGHPQLGEDVLHPVHDGDEGLHPLVAGHDAALAPPVLAPSLLPSRDHLSPGLADSPGINRQLLGPGSSGQYGARLGLLRSSQ